MIFKTLSSAYDLPYLLDAKTRFLTPIHHEENKALSYNRVLAGSAGSSAALCLRARSLLNQGMGSESTQSQGAGQNPVPLPILLSGWALGPALLPGSLLSQGNSGEMSTGPKSSTGPSLQPESGKGPSMEPPGSATCGSGGGGKEGEGGGGEASG